MIKELTLMTLPGCEKCLELKTRVHDLNLGVPIIELNPDNHSRFFDSIESSVKTNLYPIVIICNFKNEITVVCLPIDYSQYNKKLKISSNSSAIYVHSIDNMIDEIKNHYI